MPQRRASDEMVTENSADALLLELQRATVGRDDAEREGQAADVARWTMARNALTLTLMERYGERFLRYCQGVLRLGFDDADDVTQESFIKIVRSVRRFDPEIARAEAWMSSIVHNTGIDLLRRRRREIPLTEEQLATIEQISDSDLEEFFDFEVASKYTLTIVRCLIVAIDSLPETDRILLRAGPPQAGPLGKARLAAWLQLRLALLDCLIASNGGEGA